METCKLVGRALANLAFFYFYIFQNRFLQIYIFGFTIYRFAPVPPGRGLYVIKICVLSHGVPYRPAGGRQAPPNIKAEPPCICSKQYP